MSNTTPSRINQDQLEKVLIGVILGSILVLQLFFKREKTYETLLLTVHALAFLGLIGFYIRTSPRNYWTAFIAALVLYPVSQFSFIAGNFVSILSLALAIVFTVAGALFLYHSIQKSREYKTFESLGFMLGLFLVALPLLSILLGDAFDAFPLLYNFGIAFIIGTIMYNDNLWEQYQKTEQKFILLTLLIALTNVIIIASKQF